MMASQGSTSVWLHLTKTVLPEYIYNSLSLMLGVAIGSILFGVGSAWIIARYDFYGRNFIQWALLLPLAMPAYITAYSYTGLLDAAGPIQSYIRHSFGLNYGEYWFPEIQSLGGAIIIMSLVLYPYIYLLARSAFLEQSDSIQKSCRLMGYNNWQSFFLVALPIARPAILAGLALTLMETLADYGTVAYFGVSTFTTGIFRTWFSLGEVNSAAQLSIMLLSFVIILMVLEQQSRRRSRYFNSGNYQKNQPTQLNPVGSMTALILTSTPIIFGFALPTGKLLFWAFDSYQDVVNADFFKLMLNSVSLAFITAIIACAMALVVSYAKRINSNNRMINLAHKIVLSGYAIPGTVIAVGLLIPLTLVDRGISNIANTFFQFNWGLLLSGTLVALIIAYLVRFLSVSTQTIDSGLNQISPQLEFAAQSLGKSHGRILWEIHLPILRRSVLTAGLIVFVDVMKELPATLILRPFNFNTLAVKSFELASDELLSHAAPAAISIILVGLIPVILLSKAINR